ncbi:MAG: RelA/SpoT family protein [candidate division SR1 bacterium]|nr:RelA/SpoT family protein [candidate division SR1 bacterium]
MDVASLEKFLNYNPFIARDPRILLDRILQQAKIYLPDEQIPAIVKAYDFAAEKHLGQKRLSGEDYIVHPLRATQYLMEIKPDLETIQTCLLHDVVEDCNVSIDVIEKTFGNEVAVLCEGMVKVSTIKYKGQDKHLETLKKTFLAMAHDLRVIFVKLADRVHNVQTLQYHPNPVKREKIALETMKIFVPIAKRLGLYQYQLYLENGSFKVLHPEAFQSIFDYLKKYFGEGEKYTEKGMKILTDLLTKEGIKDFQIKGRIKSPYRVFEKLENRYQSQDIGNVMDLLAYRIVTKTVADCYMVLGIMHKYYTPLIKKIKDYIAVPKFNGYQSIHTTVLGMFRFPIEIQVRTYEMDEVAEYGVAAHFAYVESNQSVSVSQQQTQWIKKLQEIVNTYQSSDDKEGFKHELNLEILDKRMYLYTPQGDVIELPTGSSVLDFAFAIHTELGLRFKNALVNGLIKPISFVPQTGDIIKIDTFKNRYSANKHRLEFLHTTGAKANLTKFLKTLQKEDILKHMVDEANVFLKGYGLPILGSSDDKISKIYAKEELEKFLLGLFDKRESLSTLLKKAYPIQWRATRKLVSKTTASPKKSTDLASVIVDGDQRLNYYFCPECKPQPGQRIIAKTGRDGIKIHTLDCRAIKTISFEKFMEAHREGQEENMYQLAMEFKLATQYGNIMSIIKIFNELNIEVTQVSLKNLPEGVSIVLLESAFVNPARIAFLLNSLKKYDDSVQVLKKRIF